MPTAPAPDRHQLRIGDSLRVELWCKWADYVNPSTGAVVVGGPVVLTGAKIRATCRAGSATGAVAWVKRNTADGGSDAQVEVLDDGVGAGKTHSKVAVKATGADGAAMAAGDYLLDAVAKLSDAEATVATLKEIRLEVSARPTAGTIT